MCDFLLCGDFSHRRFREFRSRAYTPETFAAALSSHENFAVFVLWAVGPDSAIGLTAAQYPLLTLGLALGAVAGSLFYGLISALERLVTFWHPSQRRR